MSIHVLYHSPCPDGTAAAAAAYMALGETATYHPTNYSNQKPEIPDGATVYFVDFSWPRADLEALAARSKSVIVLDHHKTAAEDLADLLQPEVDSYPVTLTAVFDQNRAGCEIAWSHFFPHVEVPWLLRRVADRDLWRFNLPETKAVAAWLQMQGVDFRGYIDLIGRLDTSPEFRASVVEAGGILLKQQDALVERVISHAQVRPFPRPEISGGGVLIAVNTSLYQSEACAALLEKHPDQHIAGAYYVASNGDERWSLRSRKDGDDVSAIAKLYGGGGHRNAAGFVLVSHSTSEVAE